METLAEQFQEENERLQNEVKFLRYLAEYNKEYIDHVEWASRLQNFITNS